MIITIPNQPPLVFKCMCGAVVSFDAARWGFNCDACGRFTEATHLPRFMNAPAVAATPKTSGAPTTVITAKPPAKGAA